MTGTAVRPATRAVFFDVDFTLIYPGPTFQGAGYRSFCAQYGMDVDPAAFDRAVAAGRSGDTVAPRIALPVVGWGPSTAWTFVR